MVLPPKLELHCPHLAVANKSLELKLVSWGAISVDVDWKITKDGVQVAKGRTREHASSEQLMTQMANESISVNKHRNGI